MKISYNLHGKDALMHCATIVSEEKSILDVGGASPFQKSMSDLKHLFKDKIYHTLDYDATTNPTFVGDIHAMQFNNNAYDAIVCISVFEHIHSPHKAIEEIHRVLKPNGKLYINFLNVHPYHAKEGHYPDYFRYTKDAIELLLKDFTVENVYLYTGLFETLSLFIPIKIIRTLCKNIDYFFNTYHENMTSQYIVLATKK